MHLRFEKSAMPMDCRCLALALALVLQVALAGAARAQTDYDRVFLTNGQSILGRTEINKDRVIVRVAQTRKEHPVNEVKYIQFASEPKELTEARTAALEGEYAEALALLEKIPPPQRGSAKVREEIDFYQALSLARPAEVGIGDVQAAGRALRAFLDNYKNSHHFYEASEVTGDLLVAIGRFDQAPAYYEELARAPWPEAKQRAGVAAGRALAAQGKHAEAIKLFDAALQSAGKGTDSNGLALKARLGKAKSLVATGRPDEGIALLNETIAEGPANNSLIHAEAYNALGGAYLKQNKPKDALYAYLHVDLLYGQTPEQHAEALFHLKGLWDNLKQPQRAKQAADTLKSKYPSSKWNK